MSLDAFPGHFSEPGLYRTKVRMVGTGASAPTKLYGSDVTITRDGVGIYTLTWATNPGTFAGSTEGFQATTSADVKGCSVSLGVFSTTAYTLQIKVWDVTGTIRELAASEWLTLNIDFQRLGG